MEVNFKELKRKDLQRLCKKHGLRANATNAQMADSLVSLFKIYEKNTQGKVLSKGFGGNRSCEVEGDVEKVVIDVDEDEDERGSVLQTAERNSSSRSRIEPRLEGSSGCGDIQATRKKWHEENAIILLDDEDDEPCPVLRSPDKKKSRRSNRKFGNASEPSRSNEENQPICVLRNPKEGIFVPVRTTRSRSMNSKVAHSPVIEKTKARKDRQGAPQNAEPSLNTSEVEDNEIGWKETPSVMMAAGDVRVKGKRKSRNSSMKVNDEIMVYLSIGVSASENLAGDVVNEKDVNTVMGSDITFSIDGEQSRQGAATQNEQDIEEHELCAAGNSMEVVTGSFGTQRRKKRRRAGLEEVSPVNEKEIDKLGFVHHPELLHRDEFVEPEVCFGSPQVLGSPSLSNLASSRPCSLFSELQGSQAARTPRKIETDSSARHSKLELQQPIIFRNTEVTRNTWAEGKIDSCRSELPGSYTIEIVELEQQSKTSLSSGKEIIDPQNLIVSHITDVSTITSGPIVCSELDGKDADGTKRRNHRENYCVSPDNMKMLSACKAHHDTEEMGDVKLLEANQSHGEPMESEDGKAKESGSNLSSNGSDEKTDATNLKVPRELQIKDGGPLQLEGNALIIPEKLKHDGANLRGSEEPQALGYDEDSKAKFFAGNPPEKVEETAPLELSKRVDNLMEKLLCLKKVLRGEIAPLITDSSLSCDVDISCKESHATSKKEVASEESFPSLEQESQILNALMPTTHVHEDYEQYSSNSDVNIPNRIEVAIRNTPDALQDTPELWQCMKNCEGNDTDGASLYECSFDVRPTEGEPCQDGDVDDREFVEIVQGVTAKPGETLEDNKFVFPGKLSSSCLEGRRSSSAICISKNKSNKSITNSPAKYINLFESKCFAETLDAFNSHTSNQSYAKHTVDMLKMESHDEVAITTSSEALQGNLELYKCMESFEANSTDEASSYENDCNHKCPAEVEPCQGGDSNVVDFLETTQGATAKPREILEKIKPVFSPRKQIHINLGSERNSGASCGSKKNNLNNSITKSLPEDTKQFGSHCFSETLGVKNSLPIREAIAKDTEDVLKMEAQEEIVNTSSGDALQRNTELLECMESFAADNLDAAFPYEYDFSYNCHTIEDPPHPCDDIDAREFLIVDQCATNKPGEVLEKIKFLSPCKQSSIGLEDERNSSASCISKKANNTTDSPPNDIKDCGTQCISKTSDCHSSLPIKQTYVNHSVDILEVESQDGSIPGADTLVDAVPSEVKASFGSYTIDPIEEISRKLINFCVSSSRKAAKYNTLNTPITNSAGFSSVGLIRGKENTQSTKSKYSSKRKIRKSTSAGSIRRPLQSVTNQMVE